MFRLLWTGCLLALALPCPALTLGPPVGAAVYGRPLDIGFAVTLDDADEPGDQCAGAEVVMGDAPVPAGQVSARHDVANGLVQVQTRKPVDELVVTIAVRIGCRQLLRRTFVMLVQTSAETVAARPASNFQSPTTPRAPVNQAAAPPIQARSPIRTQSTTALPGASGAGAVPVTVPVRVQVKPDSRATKEAEPILATEHDASSLHVDRDLVLRMSDALSALPGDIHAQRSHAAALWKSVSASPEDILREREQLQSEISHWRGLALSNDTAVAQLRQDAQAGKGDRFEPVIVTGLAALLAVASALACILWLKGRRSSANLPVRRNAWDDAFDSAAPLPAVDNDPAAKAYNQQMAEKSLRKMREYGCTTFSGMPHIRYQGFKDGKPVLDFRDADAPMDLVKQLGFLAVVSYGGGISGLNSYYQDTAQMNAAGMKDYSQFIKAIYTEVQKHADERGWIPVYYNLGDEPIGDDLVRSAENAAAYQKAFPKGPPYFTAASSFAGSNQQDPHFRLSKLLHVVNWNGHDEASVNLIHAAGGGWAFYNGGNRWTFGDYMYKAAKQFQMKFRVSWHWNCVAGDPYYALDCREDDYAWCNASPDGRLIPAVHFEEIREGLGDYRRLVTLARLAREKAGTPAAKGAQQLLEARMASFHLGQRYHDALFGPDDWSAFRRKVNDAIESLR